MALTEKGSPASDGKVVFLMLPLLPFLCSAARARVEVVVTGDRTGGPLMEECIVRHATAPGHMLDGLALDGRDHSALQTASGIFEEL